MKKFNSLMRLLLFAALSFFIISSCNKNNKQDNTAQTATIDALPSWNDTPTKQAIISFVEQVTNKSSSNFVPPAERIATFDNDGTLWSEQPMIFQTLFIIERLMALAPQHPEWTSKEPFASVLKGDDKFTMSLNINSLDVVAELVKATQSGISPEEFEKIVAEWVVKAKHPTTNRLLTEMVFQPMLELLDYLRANEFKIYIVSGGSCDFMRAFSEKIYNIPPEQVIGTTLNTMFEYINDKPVITTLPELNFVTAGKGKPLAIQSRIGRRPIASFGNSDNDLPMLQWTAGGDGARFCLYVHHTDSTREWAYDRESLDPFDKGLDEARAKGWTIADMKNDWKIIHPFEKK